MEHNSFEDTAREVGEGIAEVDQKGEPTILTKLELQNLGQTFENHDQTSAISINININIIINITRPKPPYRRQGLTGSWARIHSGGYILGRSQRLTSRLRRSARIG